MDKEKVQREIENILCGYLSLTYLERAVPDILEWYNQKLDRIKSQAEEDTEVFKMLIEIYNLENFKRMTGLHIDKNVYNIIKKFRLSDADSYIKDLNRIIDQEKGENNEPN